MRIVFSVLNGRRVGGDNDGGEDVWRSNGQMCFRVGGELVGGVGIFGRI